MLLNDFKIALRHLSRRKMYTSVILFSLAIGFTCCNMLVSFLVSEVKTDGFHTHGSRTFQLFSNDPFGGNGQIPYIHKNVGGFLKETYPEVKNSCRVFNIDKTSFETDAGEYSDISLLSADSSFLSFFSFPRIGNSRKNALTTDGILLTNEKAVLLFGAADPIGKMITIVTPDTTKLVTVSGVLARPREKSHLKFDAVIITSDAMPGFGVGATYVLLDDPAHAPELERKLNANPQRPGLLEKMNYTLKPLASSYFNPDNKMPYATTRSMTFIWVCAGVCGLIFFMASFNFINLFLLSLQGRQKEAGIKKTLGASIKNLIRSSMAEVIVYVATGFLLSVILTSLLLNTFNSILDASLDLQYLFHRDVMTSIVFLVLILGVFAVIVSSIRQWRVRPVNLMKISPSRVTFHRGFFLLQFVISATLIICATTIIRQMDFIEHEPLGFNRDIIQVQSPSEAEAHGLKVLKQNLSQIPSIRNITVSNGNPISGNAIVRYDLDNGEFYTPYLFSGDEDLIKTLDLQILSGQFGSPSNPGKVVNETFVKQFQFKNPIGEKIPGTKDEVIIGVVKDFTCGSFKQKIPPVIISFNPQAKAMLIGFTGQDVGTILRIVEGEWHKVFPDRLFSYRIIQQDLLKKYKDEKFFYDVVVVSSLISIVISGFGLFALSWAVVQSRVKEIGIRKVLGATASDILSLLTMSFLKRIVISFLIAAPIGYYLMNEWLGNFAMKISLDFSIFLFSGLIVIVTACVTLSLQMFKAARLNPVEELRSE